MKIIAHDENSLTNLFFSEIYRLQKISEFLNGIEWRDLIKLPFDIAETELHHQVNLSEFGRPDAIITVVDQG